MAGGPGVPDSIPNRYAGPNSDLIPLKVFPREPLSTDKKYPIGQVVIIGRNPLTGNEGDLWYLANFTSGLADWRLLAGAGGSVTDLRDQVNTLISPTNDGYIDVDGSTVANGANPSGIPLETVAGTNTLTIQQQVATARTGAPADKNDAGTCSFDDTAFSVDANGYVTLAGGAGPAIDSINVDFNTAPGTDPVVPSAAGVMQIAGSTVANATNAASPVATHSRAANAFNIEVQVGAAVTGAPGDKNDAGLSSYNDTQFTVDADGYVSLVGAADLPGIQTLTGDSGGAIGPDASGNIDILGGAGVSVTGTTNTLTIDFTGSEIPLVGVRNLGIKLDAGTFSVVAADQTDITSTNKGYVTMASAVTPGKVITVEVTDNHQFIDDVGTSTIAGMLWGTTTAIDWASDMPFFLFAIMKDDDSEVAFGISRSPAMSVSYAAANIGVNGATVTTNQNSLFLLDKETGPTTPTVGDYDGNPALLIGSFRMTKTSGASNDWTVSTLSDEDGIGRYQWGTSWTLPSGVNGSVSGNYFQNTTGTEPVFTSTVTYSISSNGLVYCVHEHNTATAGSGAGELRPTLPCTSLLSNDAYNDALHIINSSSTYNAYTGTINANQIYVNQLVLVNATSASTLSNGSIANNDSFSMHAWYKGFN